MNIDTILGALEMAGIAVVSVGLWTLRVALAARGRKIAGSLTAGVEAIVFLLAFSSVLTDLAAVERVIGYALGVAAGTLVGIIGDQRFSTGQSEVRIVTHGTDATLVRELQGLGWPVTWTHGNGPRGEVTMAFVAVDDMRLPNIITDLERHAGEAFWTVERLQAARAVPLPEGSIGIRGGGGSRLLGRIKRLPVPSRKRRPAAV